MIHLALAVSLLAAPPTLVQRLNLGVEAEVDPGGVRGREVAAGFGGAMLMDLAEVLGGAVAATIDSGCSGDVCVSPAPLTIATVLVLELARPVVVAALARSSLAGPMAGSMFAAAGLALLGHAVAVGAAVLIIVASAGAVNGSVLFFGSVVLIDAALTGAGASLGLHGLGGGHVEPPPVIAPEPPPPPQLAPPPSAGRALVLPLAVSF